MLLKYDLLVFKQVFKQLFLGPNHNSPLKQLETRHKSCMIMSRLNHIKMIAIILIILILQLGLLVNSIADEKQEGKFQWQVGEELTYSVKWFALKVGVLKFQVLKKDSLNNRPVFHCRLQIDSHPSIPFVNIHEVYDSFIDEEMYSHAFKILIKKSDYEYIVTHDINYSLGQAKIVVSKCTPVDTTVIMDSTIVVTEKIQDGVSIFYYSRACADLKNLVEVPVISFKDIKPAKILFTGKKRKVHLKDLSLQGYYVNGRLKFEGIAGIKDNFTGWFSTDARRIPLKAQMKAVVGNVTIELESWKNWNPEKK